MFSKMAFVCTIRISLIDQFVSRKDFCEEEEGGEMGEGGHNSGV